MLYRELLADATFHNLLLAFDADLAEMACFGLPCLRRHPSLREVHAQAARPRLQTRARARSAVQLLLRRRRLPHARDAISAPGTLTRLADDRRDFMAALTGAISLR
jgi:hypothetical protein